jgi:hypothetical protein
MAKAKDHKAEAVRIPQDQATIYSELPVRDLPGFFWKRLTIQPGEMSLLIEKGQVRRHPLGPGEHTVGWRLLGFGPSRRAVARLRVDPFSLPLRFYRLGDDRDEPLDGFTQATAVVTDPNKFYQVGVAGRQRLTASQLGNAVAASVQVILDQLATSFGPAALQGDPIAQEKLTGQLAPLLEDQLQDRGMRLEKVYSLVFRPSRESETLLEEALALQSELADAGEKSGAEIRTKVEAFASRALGVELASSSEIDALRSAAGAPTTDPGSVLVGFMQRSVERLTGRVSERAQRLPAPGQPGEMAGPYKISLSWLNTLLGWVVLGAVLVAVLIAGPFYPLFKSSFDIDPRLYFGGSYGALFLVITAVQFCRWAIDQWERWRRKQVASDAAGPAWFEQWLTKDAFRVDELVRRQIATELEEGPMVGLREAMYQSHSGGRSQETQEARRLGEELRYLAERIRGAEYSSTTLPLVGQKTVQLGARLVAFEEESLRLARGITSRTEQLKALASSGGITKQHLDQVGEAMAALRRHFANRTGVVVGVPMPVATGQGNTASLPETQRLPMQPVPGYPGPTRWGTPRELPSGVLLLPHQVAALLRQPLPLSKERWLAIQACIGPASPSPLYDLSARVDEILYGKGTEQEAS